MAWGIQRTLGGGSSFPMPTAGQFNSPAFRSFLAAHPTLAGITSQADLNRFLGNHPDIAQAYTRLLSPAPAAAPVAPAAPPAPAVSTTPATSASAQATDQSGKAVVEAALAARGLPGLGAAAWQRYLDLGGDSNQYALDVIYNEIKSNAPWTNGAYQARYPGMAELEKQGRGMTEAEYRNAEESYRQAMRAYGIPAEFYDEASDFTKLIVGGVSAKEFDERLQMAEQVAMTDPRSQILRDELARQGIPSDAGTATAYFLDPDRMQNVIKQQYQAAVTGREAITTGFGNLTLDQENAIAGYGLSAEQQRGTFSQLAGLNELRRDLPGMAPDSVSNDEALAAGFGQDAAARRKIERTGKTRVAALQGGGGYASSQRGLTGLGTAGS